MLCSRDVSESLEELEAEWSRKDPRDSWVMISRGPKGEHFMVEVDAGGRKVGTFTHTSSTRNFISRFCVGRLRLRDQVQRLHRSVASTSANKHNMVVQDYVKDVVCTFSYGGGELRHKISFLVSDELPFDMLLDGLRPDDAKVPNIRDWPRHQTVIQTTVSPPTSSRLPTRRAIHLAHCNEQLATREDVVSSLLDLSMLQARQERLTLHVAALRRLLAILSDPDRTLLIIPVRLGTSTRVYLVLWDSGSQCDFIHPRVVKEARLPTTRSSTPISVTLGDDKTRRFFDQTVTDLPFFLTLEPTDHPPTSPRHQSSAHFDVMETGYDFIQGTPWSCRFQSTEADWATNTLVLRMKCGQTYRVPFIGTTTTPCPDPPPPKPSTPTPSPTITVTSPRQFAHFIRENNVTFFTVNVTDILHYDPPYPDVELISLERDPPSISMATHLRRFFDQTVTDLPFFLTLELTDRPPTSPRHQSSAHFDVMETRYDFIQGTPWSRRFQSTEADWATNTLVLRTKCGQTYRVPFIGTTATPRPDPPPPEPSAPTPSPTITVTSPRQFAHFIRENNVTFFTVNVADILHYDPPYPDAELISLERDPPSISMATHLYFPPSAVRDCPIAFYSRQLLPVEINYTVDEREVLTVVHATRHWRHYLHEAPFTVRTNNSVVQAFLTKPKLTPRQAHWWRDLSEFSFTIEHIKGETNRVADALSRRPDRNLEQIQLAAISVTIVHHSVTDEFRTQYRYYPDYCDIHATLRSGKTIPNYSLGDNGIVYSHGSQSTREPRICVPSTGQLRVQAFAEFHDEAVAGHWGFHKTLARVSRPYVWPKRKDFVKDYVAKCPTCQEANSVNHLPYGLLQPLPIPEGRWQSISMDFIGPLRPPTPLGHDAILVVVDLFTNRARSVPCRYAIRALEVVDIVFDRVVSDHGLPLSIISHHDPRFTN
ncbi:hypothetical protein CBR_g16097 [Chara braunii]|uniref:Integrase catalytic domain-containing protein n=1 Tax=Chara braunii TaxID=69332 RepID=A0A388KTX0_CHABU|nr:hypothetical protein CBR_g16097 [Chara braunii]|eukprot:GBG73383.1 hypothetical protein CBR_g16097 [Chara braunii]